MDLQTIFLYAFGKGLYWTSLYLGVIWTVVVVIRLYRHYHKRQRI